jgi:hypothetical protein
MTIRFLFSPKIEIIVTWQSSFSVILLPCSLNNKKAPAVEGPGGFCFVMAAAFARVPSGRGSLAKGTES